MRPTTGIAEGEGAGAWLAMESVRDLYVTDVLEEAATLPAKTITGSLEDGFPKSARWDKRCRAVGRRS